MNIGVGATGGSGNYSYTYAKVSGYGDISASGTTGTVTLTENIPSAAVGSVTYTGVFQVTVHDNVYGANDVHQQTISFTYTNTA